MIIKREKEVDVRLWYQLFKSSKYSSVFQSPEYYNFYNSVGVNQAEVVAVEDAGVYKSLVVLSLQREDGLKSYFSRRGIIFSGMLLSDVDSADFLLKALKKYYKSKLIYLQIRNSFDYSAYKDIFEQNGFDYTRHNNVLIDVADIDYKQALARMKYNRRREIKQTFKEGANVNLAENTNEVEQLYQIVDELYKERVKLPMPDLQFFIKLYHSTIGRVFIVKHDNKVIGGAFCLYQKGQSINTLYYAGLRRYKKKVYPTHLAIAGVLDFAINERLSLIDLMGAGNPDEDYGVRNYKMEFGGELVEYGRFECILNPLLYSLGKKAVQFLQKKI